MSGYPGGGYPGNQGGYPGGGASGRPQGTSGYPAQGGYPSGQPVSGGYPGANSTQGGYPGASPSQGGGSGHPVSGGYPGANAAQGGYPGASPSQGGGYPGQNPYQPGPGAQQAGYPAGGPQTGGPQTGQYGGQSSGMGGYGQPPVQVQIDPSVQQWFSAVDSDKSGQIDGKELQRALVNGNWSHFSEEACRMMIELYDRNGSGTIDINEFQQLFTSINQWRGTFQGFDTDRSGSIEQAELTKAFQQMGYRFTPMFVEKLCSKYGMRTKKISLDNFIVINIQIKRLSDGFRTRDTMKNGQATMQYEDFVGLAMGVHQ